ncbi:MAG: mandelate racemase/muconate lactonizing enzyme family protein [Pirellulales bacterium]
MKITSVETFPVRIPLKAERRMITALGQHIVSDYLIVRVRTDQGIDGVGEATVMPNWSGETLWGAQAIIEKILGPAVLEGDPANIVDIDARLDRRCRHNWFAKAAIEMACWDIAGKAAGKPVYELLGGAVRPLTIRSRFSMGAYDVERARRRAQELVDAGFTTIKVKVGGPAADDIARVRAVREVIGPKLALTIDANCGWDVDTAVHCVNELEDCNISLNEQPTPDGDYGGLARVRRETKPPVMADDMVFNLSHAKELVRNEACDVISLYPGKNGGIRKSREIAEYAAANGVACSIGSNLEFDISTAAMMHLIVSTPNVQVEKFPGDVLGPDYHEFSIATNPIEIKGPLTTITDRPGLGVDVDWAVVEKHKID